MTGAGAASKMTKSEKEEGRSADAQDVDKGHSHQKWPLGLHVQTAACVFRENINHRHALSCLPRARRGGGWPRGIRGDKDNLPSLAILAHGTCASPRLGNPIDSRDGFWPKSRFT